MKKIFRIFAAAAMAFAAAACAKEVPSGNSGKEGKLVHLTFTVNKDEINKTALLEDCKTVVWEEKDTIYVFPKSSAGTDKDITGAKFALVSGAGTASGVFEGDVAESSEGYFAIASKGNVPKYTQGSASSNSSTFSSSFVTEYEVGKFFPVLAGYCASGQNVFNMQIVNGFIKATIGTSTVHKVKNLYIQTCVEKRGKVAELSKEGITSVTISGACRFRFTGEDVPGSTSNSGQNNIQMKPSKGNTEIAAGTYYLAAGVAGKPTELFFVVEDTEGNAALLHGPSVSIERNKVLALPAINPDELAWFPEGSQIPASATKLGAVANDDNTNVSVSATLKCYNHGTPTGDVAWKIQSRMEGEDDWEDTDLSGTGSTVEGEVTGLSSGVYYTLRIVCGDKAFPESDPVMPGSKTVVLDTWSSGWTPAIPAQSNTSGEYSSSHTNTAGYTITIGNSGTSSKRIGTSGNSIYFNIAAKQYVSLPIISGYHPITVGMTIAKLSVETNTASAIITTSLDAPTTNKLGNLILSQDGSWEDSLALTGTDSSTTYYVYNTKVGTSGGVYKMTKLTIVYAVD